MIDPLVLALLLDLALFSRTAMAQAPLCKPPESLGCLKGMPTSGPYVDLLAADFEGTFSALTGISSVWKRPGRTASRVVGRWERRAKPLRRSQSARLGRQARSRSLIPAGAAGMRQRCFWEHLADERRKTRTSDTIAARLTASLVCS